MSPSPVFICLAFIAPEKLLLIVSAKQEEFELVMISSCQDKYIKNTQI